LAFLYGFPNPIAEAVFKRAGYHRATSLRRYARVMRWREFLKKKIGRPAGTVLAPMVDLVQLAVDLVAAISSAHSFRWVVEKTFDAQFDDLWEKGRARRTLTGERSAAALRWRFQEVPERPAVKVLKAFSRKGGALSGYAVMSVEAHSALVLDVYSAGAPQVVSALLRQCSWKARRAGCRAISVELTASEKTRQAVRRAGFLPREEHPVYFLEGTGEVVRPDSDWFLTTFDRD
jgi:hypothetical protein